MKFRLVEDWDRLEENTLEEGLHQYLNQIATLMAANGYTNIVVDTHTNKIIGDKHNKTYLFEVIFDAVNARLNDRFYINNLDSVNKQKRVYSQPSVPIGVDIGKAGVGHKVPENRRQYIPGVFIWELDRLSPIDPTTWP